MKILVTPTSFTKPENSAARETLERFAGEVVYNPYGRPLKAEEILPLLDGVDGYIAGLDYITADVIEKAPASLKVISRYGAGVDRVDLPAAKKKGIAVTNTPGTNAVAVCELAFALMLTLARSVVRLDKAVRKGEWPRNDGVELRGKTLGIAGLGAIGKNIAKRAKAFEMNVVAFDPYFDAAFGSAYGVANVSLDELLSVSDVVTLHMPLNDKTHHAIGADAFAKMKDGVLLINTARGGLIDEAAAEEALKTGKLGGLGLDVYEAEPVSASPLIAYDNVVMTPHTGAHTKEAIVGMGVLAVENLIKVLSGESGAYLV